MIVSAAQAMASPARNVHNNSVTRQDAWDTRPFVVKNQQMVAELNTVPSDGSFVPGSGRVVVSERHNNVPWSTKVNSAILHQALSPPIPANTSSQVICIGLFATPPGGQGTPPPWRSDLFKPGVHVIVINQYNTEADCKADSKGVSHNMLYIYSGDALVAKYARDSSGRVLRVTCGLSGDIQQIDQLPGYLRNLNPPVADHTVNTYDTLGHGACYEFTVNGVTERAMVMQGARQTLNQLDTIGNPTDLAIIQLGNPPDWHPLTFAQYADLIRPFLRDDAIVNFLHCLTGEPYKFFADATGQGRVNRPSVAAQLDAAIGGNVIASGITNICRFEYDFYDLNGNGHVDPGEVDGYPPQPTLGGTWQINQ